MGFWWAAEKEPNEVELLLGLVFEEKKNPIFFLVLHWCLRIKSAI
jgi:hypothetical protein